MAFNRLSDLKQIGGDFSLFIDAQMSLYRRQLNIRNSEEEVSFNEAVLAGNLSLDEQLTWRQEQGKRAKGDPDEVKRIRNEVASLKDQIEQKEFSDGYIQRLATFESGATSIDSVITWLETQLANTTDLRIKEGINEALVTQKARRFTIQRQVIQNQTEFAIADKSAEVLNDHLKVVRTARNNATFAGDPLLESVYNLQIQAIEKAVTENRIQRTITNFAVSTLTNGSNAIGLLDAYGSEINNSSETGNITIGGTNFGSAREFWRFRRGEYLSDNGQNGFFSRFSIERIQTLNLITSARDLNILDIQSAASEFDKLRGRDELKAFEFQIDIARQATIQTGTNQIASQILSTFNKDFDVDNAVTALNSLKSLGGSVTSTFDKVIETAAANKSSQVSGILDTVNELLRTNPGMSAEQALEKAIATGAGSILSPEQLVGKPEGEIVREQIAGAEEEKFITDPRTTIKEPETEPPPVVPEAPQATPAQEAEARFSFATQLDRGASSGDVLELQKFLNRAGFAVAQAGPGAPGSETSFFGPLTQKAVQEFQKAQGIVSAGTPQTTGFGRVGPKTLQALNIFKFQ